MDEMPYTDARGRVYKYGEFYPPELSPWSYNETLAQEYFPLTKEEAISLGYRWKDVETKEKEAKLTEDEKFAAKDELQKIIDEANRGLEATFEKKQKEVMG